ncbi:hypothetical protein M885DRAFT_563886 [Pelagophyceae sp. CCMP2097]|nr:hypothetical protein M885DRAFT_563886 [Pelagophyceae sp. CCMP2097]
MSPKTIVKESVAPSRRLGAAWAEMLSHCPEAISAYGLCVKDHVELGLLEHGVCDAEFAQLKQCFHEARQR